MEQKDRLKEARRKRSYSTATEAARAFGWVESTYLAHENGTRPISRKAALTYAAAFRVKPGWLLYGEKEAAPNLEPILVPVRGIVACGIWAENGRFMDDEFPPIPAVPTLHKSTSQFAFKVSGQSMDRLRILEGDFVVCVPYWEVRATIADGDVVVIERRQGHLTERTCKQVALTKKRLEFWSRSTDPAYAKPLVLNDVASPLADDGTEIEIVGLVVGRYAPI